MNLTFPASQHTASQPPSAVSRPPLADSRLAASSQGSTRLPERRLGREFLRMILWALALGVGLYLAGRCTWSYRRVVALRSELGDERTENRERQKRIDQLRRQAQALRHDPQYVERLLRKELNLARPGEWAIRPASEPKMD